MTRGAEDGQYACQCCQYRQQFMHCRSDEGRHQGYKYKEDDPIQHHAELARMLGQRDAKKAHNPVNSRVTDGPRGEYPGWVAFIRVIFP